MDLGDELYGLPEVERRPAAMLRSGCASTEIWVSAHMKFFRKELIRLAPASTYAIFNPNITAFTELLLVKEASRSEHFSTST